MACVTTRFSKDFWYIRYDSLFRKLKSGITFLSGEYQHAGLLTLILISRAGEKSCQWDSRLDVFVVFPDETYSPLRETTAKTAESDPSRPPGDANSRWGMCQGHFCASIYVPLCAFRNEEPRLHLRWKYVQMLEIVNEVNVRKNRVENMVRLMHIQVK